MTHAEFNDLLLIVVGAGFLCMFVLEFAVPSGTRKSLPEWLGHSGRNLALWVTNLAIIRFLLGAGPLTAAFWVERNGVGALQWVDLPVWAAVVLGVLLIDFSDYVFHRISHNVRPLWLLHAVHHSDPGLDVTTNLRAHPLQILLILQWKVLVTIALGLPAWALLIRELLVIPVAQLQHASVYWPAALERALRWLIVTPAMHRLHHTSAIEQTNSNYGELFPFWDWLFGTYRFSAANVAGPFGLARLRGPEWHSVFGMLVTPLRARKFAQL